MSDAPEPVPTLSRRQIVVLLAGWSFFFVFAFVRVALLDGYAQFFGFWYFLAFQVVAALFAYGAFRVSLAWPEGHRVRKLAKASGVVSLIMFMAMIAFFVWCLIWY